MNTLILGAIFLVALLAIGGAVWLAMGERQGNGNAPAPATSAAPGGQPQLSAPAASTKTTGGQGRSEGRTAAVTMPLEPGELMLTSTHAVAHSEQGFPVLNGQFYELVTELRALHREAQDIERRLSVLTEMVSRIEQEYGEVGVETE